MQRRSIITWGSCRRWFRGCPMIRSEFRKKKYLWKICGSFTKLLDTSFILWKKNYVAYQFLFLVILNRVSKVEVIDQVIDYIHELRMALGLPPCPTSNNNVDMQLMQSTIRMLPNLVNTSSDNLRNNRVQNYSSSNVSINSISPSSRNFLCPQPQKNCPILCNHNSLNISERK